MKSMSRTKNHSFKLPRNGSQIEADVVNANVAFISKLVYELNYGQRIFDLLVNSGFDSLDANEYIDIATEAVVRRLRAALTVMSYSGINPLE